MDGRPHTSHDDWRGERLAALGARRFDLLVVGGGITGAAVAHGAASHGLSVALVEQSDFAGGTSGRSSRLIHGGLRYLKQLHLGLVRDSLAEQRRLARLAPHLVRPLRMLVPLYGRGPASRCGHRLGMLVYSSLRPGASVRRDARTLAREEPLLDAHGLQGGYACREYLTHDARLVWETVLAAAEAGAVVLNYARVCGLLEARGRVVGAAVRDLLSGRTTEVSARVVVNAAGPWADRVGEADAKRLRLTKGVHVFLPRRRLPLTHAVALRGPRDGRHMVAIPFENLVLAGPTETDFRGRPEEARPDKGDVAYLLEALSAAFPRAGLSADDAVAARAGLRPLYDDGAPDAGEVSRSYRVEWRREGLLAIVGGKLTLHRRAARAALRLISRGSPVSLPDAPLPGAAWDGLTPARVAEELRDAGLEEDSVAHLVSTYGARAALFVPLLADEPGLRRTLVRGLPHPRAEVVFAARREMAVRAEDFTERRTDLALRAAAEGESLPEDVWWSRTEGRARACAAAAAEGGAFR